VTLDMNHIEDSFLVDIISHSEPTLLLFCADVVIKFRSSIWTKHERVLHW